MDNRAQISAELLIIMAAVIAIALILLKSLMSTASSGAEKLNKSSSAMMDEIDGIIHDYHA